MCHGFVVAKLRGRILNRIRISDPKFLRGRFSIRSNCRLVNKKVTSRNADRITSFANNDV